MFRTRDILRHATRMLEPVARSYERRLDQLGAEPRAVFWKNEDNQVLRFEMLYGIFDEVDQAGGLTINDFGCGYGAFFEFLADQPVMRRSRYIGYDMSEKMINAAEARISDPRASFVCHVAVTEPGDYTFACGTYNMHLRAHEGDWDRYIKESLKQLWSKTHKGLGFNLLRASSLEKFDGLFYVDGQDYLDFCRRELSDNVIMQEDPHLPDYMFYVRRS